MSILKRLAKSAQRSPDRAVRPALKLENLETRLLLAGILEVYWGDQPFHGDNPPPPGSQVAPSEDQLWFNDIQRPIGMGDSFPMYITLHNAATDPQDVLEIYDVTEAYPGGEISAYFESGVEIAPGGFSDFMVWLDTYEVSEPGVLTDGISIASSDSLHSYFSFGVAAEVGGETTAGPEIELWYGDGRVFSNNQYSSFVGEFAQGQPASFQLSVFNSGDEVLYVHEPIFMDGDSFRADALFSVNTTVSPWLPGDGSFGDYLAVAPQSWESISVDVNTAAPLDFYDYQMVMPTNDPVYNPFVFNFSGSIYPVDEPEISVYWDDYPNWWPIYDGEGWFSYDEYYSPVVFGPAALDSTPPTRTFYIYNDGPSGSLLELTGLSVPDNFTILDGIDSHEQQLAYGDSAKITVAMETGTDFITEDGAAIEIASNAYEAGLFSIPVFGMVMPPALPVVMYNAGVEETYPVIDGLGYVPYESFPQPVDIGIVPLGGPQPSLEFVVYNAGGSPLMIETPYLADQDGNPVDDVFYNRTLTGFWQTEGQYGYAVIDNDDYDSAGFRFTFDTSYPALLDGLFISFATNSPDIGQFTIPLAGAIGEAYPIDISVENLVYGAIVDGQAQSIGFGSTTQNQTPRTHSFLVTNHGLNTVAFAGVSVPAPFTVVDPLANLAPGESDEFVIALQTGAVGNFSGLAQIIFAEGMADPFVFPINGSVVAPPPPPPVLLPPEIAVTFDGQRIPDGLTTTIDFGTMVQGDVAPAFSFVVTNLGEEVLSLSAPQLPAGFILTEPLASSLAANQSDTFTITLDTSAAGAFAGTVFIANNDSRANPFDFPITALVTEPPVPEINVSYNSIALANNQAAPIDYGTFRPGEAAASYTFLVSNAGTAPLTLGAPVLPAGFVLTEALDALLEPGAADSFTVTFAPDVAGSFAGNVVIANNDPDEAPFRFPVLATVVAPEIAVSYGGQPIADGQVGIIDFGTFAPGGAGTALAFTVTNVGADTLTLGAPSLPAGFILTEALAASLAPGASDTFTVQLDTAARGNFGGQVSIANNDAGANPFNWPISGVVAAPDIAVYLDGVLIEDGQSPAVDFGQVNLGGAPLSLTFTVRNYGNETLALSSVSLPTGFVLDEPLASSLPPGAYDTFTVSLTTAEAGAFAGELSFSNSDVDKDPFNFPLVGQVLQPVPLTNNRGVLEDEGVRIFVTLAGPGDLQVFASPVDPLTIESIILTETTARSTLNITMVGAGVGYVGDINVAGALGAAVFRGVDLTGSFEISETVDALLLGNVGPAAKVTAGDYSPVGTTVMANHVGAGAEFDIPGRIRMFRAASFPAGALTAGCFDSILISSGDSDVDITAQHGMIGTINAPGNLTGNILAYWNINTIFSPGGSFSATVRARRLGTLVAGELHNALISTALDMNVLMVRGDVIDSHVLAGYDIGLDGIVGGTDDQIGQGGIRFFSYGGELRNSHVALGVVPTHSPLFGATSVESPSSGVASSGYVSGRNVVSDNGGQPFGFYFDANAGSRLTTGLQPTGDFVIVSQV